VDIASTRLVAFKGGSEGRHHDRQRECQAWRRIWSAIAPLQSAGKIRVLAVALPERFSSLPDTPTATEADFPGVEILFWFAISEPSGLPDNVVQSISMVPFFHTGSEMPEYGGREKDGIQELWAVKS